MRYIGVGLSTLLLVTSLAVAKSNDVSYDQENHTVSFTAVSTDCGVDTDLEFLFVGPNSDHDYESMFTTLAPMSEIVNAFTKAGFPLGEPMSVTDCKFWATGDEIIMEPSITNFVKDLRSNIQPRLIYTGGTRNKKGEANAAVTMPAALFALYNCPQSLILYDDFLDQSSTYGRFKPAVKIPKGEKRRITFKLMKGTSHLKETVKINETNLQEVVKFLKTKSERSYLDILCDFSAKMTLKTARNVAELLQIIDSNKIKINGVKEGQLYYKAYLPLEKWRDRKERLAQPPEVRFRLDGSVSVTEVKEDWSDEKTLDPKLIPVETIYTDLNKAANAVDLIASKVLTVFLYANESTQLKTLFEFRKKLKTSNLNIYVFIE